MTNPWCVGYWQGGINNDLITINLGKDYATNSVKMLREELKRKLRGGK